MLNQIIRMLNNFGSHFIKNISDYTLLFGVSLILRWIYVVKGFDSFTLSLGMLMIFISFVNSYSKK